MKIRTAYFKVTDMTGAVGFWSALLQRQPVKQSERWSEFLIGETRLGLLLNDFGETLRGSGCVPVFEFDASELAAVIERAQALGATVVLDGLTDPRMKAIVLAGPGGHEFELCAGH